MSLVLRVDPAAQAVDLLWDGGLVDGPDIPTAVLMSLFSDARAPTNTPGLPQHELRGYWGDPSLGSRIWLAFREPLTTAAVNLMRSAAESSLAWMVADGVASRVEVEVERLTRDAVRLAVAIYRGQSPVWSAAWKVTAQQVEQFSAI